MKAGTVFKIIIPLAVAGAIGYYILQSSIPTAIVSKATRSTAVNAVPGTVAVIAEKEMLIKGEHGGRVAISNLEKGGIVSSGDILIQLDTGDIDLDLEKAENEYRQAERNIEIRSPLQLQLESSKEALSDLEFRFKNGGVREVDVTRAQRALAKIEDDIDREKLKNDSQLEALDIVIKRLKRQKSKMTITSPIDGIITDIFAHKGDLIGGGATIAKVVSLSRIVEVKVSEEHFEGLEIGMPARVSFLGIDSVPFKAEVEQIIPVADQSTQRFTVHLKVDIDPNRLDPGLTGDATITLDENQNALQVPRQAIVANKALVVESGTVVEKEIQTGYTSITMIEVLDGLDDDDLVIVEDLHLFEGGDRVSAQLKN